MPGALQQGAHIQLHLSSPHTQSTEEQQKRPCPQLQSEQSGLAPQTFKEVLKEPQCRGKLSILAILPTP